MLKSRFFPIMIVALVLTFVGSGPRAWAKESAAQMTEAVSRHRLALLDVKKGDPTRAFDREVTKMEDWLNQAGSDIAADKLKQAKRLLIRIDAQAIMLHELVAMAEFERRAEESRKAMSSADEALRRARAALQAAEQRKRELESKGY